MEQLFEPTQLFGIAEDDSRDRRPVRPGRADYLRPEARDELAPNVGVLAQQPVNDGVAGDGRRAVAAECFERCALTGSDPAGDRDREWAVGAR